MSHLTKVIFYFFGALIVDSRGAEPAPASSRPVPCSDCFSALVVSPSASPQSRLLAGITITQQARARFSLMQTGRIAQYTAFWLCGLVSLKLAALVLWCGACRIERCACLARCHSSEHGLPLPPPVASPGRAAPGCPRRCPLAVDKSGLLANRVRSLTLPLLAVQRIGRGFFLPSVY